MELEDLDLSVGEGPEEPESGAGAPAEPAAQNDLLEVLYAVQTQSTARYPPGTMDDTNDFDLRLIGIGDKDKHGADERLLQKLMAQITDGLISSALKVCSSAPPSSAGVPPPPPPIPPKLRGPRA